jgi:hypothetical protein
MIGIGRLTSGSTGSDHCFELVKSWLQDCDDNHMHCLQERHAALPKRVIELIDFEEPPKIRLSEPDLQAGGRGSYLCLSHRWGDAPLLQTTSQNYHQFCEQIPWDQLPPTFQDCIRVAKHLSIKYVWIDTLCVIQDSRSDWVSQAIEMSKIYEQSYLTVFATKATTSHEGLFETLPSKEKPRRYHGCDPVSKHNFCVNVRKAIPHPSAPGRTRLKQEAPLLSRAWVYQEHLLSRRILHFCQHEVVWECIEGTKCECSSELEGTIGQVMHQLRASLASNSRTEVIARWHTMVSQFTGLSLTYSTDRLAALAGLVDRFHAVRPGVCVSGIWTDSIAFDLAWYNASAQAKRSDCVAPTWSWASLDSRVLFLAMNDLWSGKKTNFIKTNVTLAGDRGRTSLIPSSIDTLELSGRMIDTRLQKAESSFSQLQVDPTVFMKYLTAELGNYELTFHPDVAPEVEHLVHYPVHLLLLLSQVNGDHGHFTYLVLRGVGGMTFVRIGLFTVRLTCQPVHAIKEMGVEETIVLK